MRYYHSVNSKFLNLCITYSIDKVILCGKFFYKTSQQFLDDLSLLEFKDGFNSDDYPFINYVDTLSHYESNRIGFYYHNFNINLVNCDNITSSFYLGVCLNSGDGKIEQWKLEFNPNKIHPCNFFKSLLNLLRKYSVPTRTYLKSWDLAIDFPISRSEMSLVRDNRKYQLITKSSEDRTEYLGCRQNVGFCKLYNKQIESKLENALTRFEITLDSIAYVDLFPYLPKILILGDSQVSFNCLTGLSHNQVVYLELLLLHPEYLQKLDKNARPKYQKCFDMLSKPFEVDKNCFMQLVNDLQKYLLLVG